MHKGKWLACVARISQNYMGLPRWLQYVHIKFEQVVSSMPDKYKKVDADH